MADDVFRLWDVSGEPIAPLTRDELVTIFRPTLIVGILSAVVWLLVALLFLSNMVPYGYAANILSVATLVTLLPLVVSLALSLNLRDNYLKRNRLVLFLRWNKEASLHLADFTDELSRELARE